MTLGTCYPTMLQLAVCEANHPDIHGSVPPEHAFHVVETVSTSGHWMGACHSLHRDARARAAECLGTVRGRRHSKSIRTSLVREPSTEWGPYTNADAPLIALQRRVRDKLRARRRFTQAALMRRELTGRSPRAGARPGPSQGGPDPLVALANKRLVG